MRRVVLLVTVFMGAALVPQAQAQQVKGAVDRGLQYLKGKVGSMSVGEAGLTALTFNKADVPNNDPAMATALKLIFSTFKPEGYEPALRGGPEIYEAAVVAMALANIDPVQYKNYVAAVANYIIAKQKPNGSWDYDGRPEGDTSIGQYALLALWEADGLGIEIPPRVWDMAASWYLSVQFSDGGWNYHKDQEQAYPETVSMTGAGVSSLLICERQLAIFRRGNESIHPLLTPLVVEGSVAASYKPITTRQATISAARRGVEWLARNYAPAETMTMGQSTYYGLYTMERVGALASAEKDLLRGLTQWFEKGLAFVLANQRADGSWMSRDKAHLESNTPWAILFAVRATEKSMRKIEIRRLGSGTLMGGRGLPENLDNMMIAQGRVVVRPMNGAVEGMIAILEDPRASNADSALAGLVDRYQKLGPSSLKPFKDRFRKLLSDRDPGVRSVACWALARTSDLDVAPLLIRALLDPDEGVVGEARVGLELLSRKVESFGPPRNANAEQKLAAARQWRTWYEENRPPDLDALDDPGLGAKRALGGQQ
jgi:hypothetical protein